MAFMLSRELVSSALFKPVQQGISHCARGTIRCLAENKDTRRSIVLNEEHSRVGRIALPLVDTRPIIPRLNTRLPFFEVALFLAVLAVGWAVFHTGSILSRLERAPSPGQGHDALGIQEILKLQALLDVKDRYLALADQLESGLGEMRDALQVFLRERDRAEIGRYLRRGQMMQLWVRRQRESQDTRKLQMLRDWLAGVPSFAAGSNMASTLDLDTLPARIEHSFSNYLGAVQIAEGQSLSVDLVQQKLIKAAEPEQELLTMAGQARMKAAAIDSFVERRPAELAEQARAVHADRGFLAWHADVGGAMRPLFYALVLLLVVECALLIVALYGRVVVAPLRQKLIEDNTAVEQQKKLDHFARLATGLAHEIRNPLTAINVRLFTLQKAMGKGTPEALDSALIRNEIDRLEQVLKNFLKLARPTEPKFAVLTAGPILEEILQSLGPQLSRQGIELKVGSTTDVRFKADPVQLKQVLLNLIHNAAEGIGRDGTITLRGDIEEVRSNNRTLRMAVIEVEDTGPGISPEVQERLFDPFFSTKENGTGLGLPIAVKIIDQHKGMLDFDTRIGRGTTFRVLLPVSH